jgi:hypothetical protein
MNELQQILIYLCSGLAGVLIGLLLYYFIRRLQKKGPAPLSHAVDIKESKPLSEEQIELGVEVRKIPASAPQAKTVPAAPPAAVPPIAAKEPFSPKKSEIQIELEKNLSIATTPWTGKMASFQTKAWDTYGGRVDSVPSDLYGDLMEAYADMRLANTLVWLSSDVGRKNKDLDQSYLTLCNKISERIQKVRTALNRAGAPRVN